MSLCVNSWIDLFNLWIETFYFECYNILWMLGGDHLVEVETDSDSSILLGRPYIFYLAWSRTLLTRHD